MKLRDTFINIRDELDDEGDRVYFGSTNHAEMFKDVVEELDQFKWERILSDGKAIDYCAIAREANERAAAAIAQRARLAALLDKAATVLTAVGELSPPDEYGDGDRIHVFRSG